MSNRIHNRAFFDLKKKQILEKKTSSNDSKQYNSQIKFQCYSWTELH